MISPRKRFSSTSSLQQAFACWGAKVERIARFFVFLDICDPFYPGIFFQAEGVLPKQPPSEVGVQTCRRSQNYSVFFCYLRSSALGSFLWVAREGSSSRASRSKIAEDRKLYVFIVTSDLLQFVPLFDLQNQDNRSMNHISRTLRYRGTEKGCKASSQKMPCTECHHQINI